MSRTRQCCLRATLRKYIWAAWNEDMAEAEGAASAYAQFYGLRRYYERVLWKETGVKLKLDISFPDAVDQRWIYKFIKERQAASPLPRDDWDRVPYARADGGPNPDPLEGFRAYTAKRAAELGGTLGKRARRILGGGPCE